MEEDRVFEEDKYIRISDIQIEWIKYNGILIFNFMILGQIHKFSSKKILFKQTPDQEERYDESEDDDNEIWLSKK